eukprot:4400784-Alexandrium_andersonii.AAC.1
MDFRSRPLPEVQQSDGPSRTSVPPSETLPALSPHRRADMNNKDGRVTRTMVAANPEYWPKHA